MVENKLYKPAPKEEKRPEVIEIEKMEVSSWAKLPIPASGS